MPVQVAAPGEDALVRGYKPVSAQGGGYDDAVSRIGVEVHHGGGADPDLAVDGDLDHALPELLPPPQRHVVGVPDASLVGVRGGLLLALGLLSLAASFSAFSLITLAFLPATFVIWFAAVRLLTAANQIVPSSVLRLSGLA